MVINNCTLDQDNRTEVSSTCNFACPLGYLINNITSIRCNSHLTWSTIHQPQCVPLCPPLLVYNHTQVDRKHHHCFSKPSVAGSLCKTSCNISTTRMCQTNGLWTGQMDVCGVHCPKLHVTGQYFNCLIQTTDFDE